MSGGGGLLQLVAIGAQDSMLIGNPDITFFQLVTKSHSNFAVESIDQTFNGKVDFGSSVSATISRNGDLVSGMCLEMTLPKLSTGTWVGSVGYHMIKRVSLSIGGQEIDAHYGEWMNIWNELARPGGHDAAYETLCGRGVTDSEDHKLTVPLQFWFCKNVGLALPLIALQYHEVKVNVQFADLETVAGAGAKTNGCLESTLWVDYVYLDNAERQRFATSPHNYLISQVQTTGEESIYGKSQRFRLDFNHPVKELVWVCKGSDGYAVNGDNPTKSCRLMLNGHERFKKRTGEYFDRLQPLQHHSNTPSGRGINVYSFALKPEEVQPSGSCNFSRIDNAVMEVEFTDFDTEKDDTSGNFYDGAVMEVYAVNYNQLRVISGMGGLTYSN
jgi:hypothetical protein